MMVLMMITVMISQMGISTPASSSPTWSTWSPLSSSLLGTNWPPETWVQDHVALDLTCLQLNHGRSLYVTIIITITVIAMCQIFQYSLPVATPMSHMVNVDDHIIFTTIITKMIIVKMINNIPVSTTWTTTSGWVGQLWSSERGDEDCHEGQARADGWVKCRSWLSETMT